MTEADRPGHGSTQREPPPWRAGVDPERRRRRRRINDQPQALRRLTVGAAVAAAGLNALLFTQTGLEQVGAGGLQQEIVSMVEGVFPGAGLRPAASPPTPSPNGRPVATTGAS